MSRKAKHRATHNYIAQALQDLYAALHYAAHNKATNKTYKAVCVFFIRHATPRPAPAFYTKGLKNPELELGKGE